MLCPLARVLGLLMIGGALGFAPQTSLSSDKKPRVSFHLEHLSTLHQTTGATEQTPMTPRELPPLFSDVIKKLPMPFSGVSPETVPAKLQGN